MEKIILATASPYRQEAFKMLDIDFEAEASEIDENFNGRPEDPEKLVSELAKRKAEQVAKNHKEGIIIGFDSIGWFKNKILEKPKNRREACERLKMLSGGNHQFYTGICIVDLSKKESLSRVVKTDIKLKELSDDEINKYLSQDPHYATYAIGFDPLKHYSSSFAESISGSYNNYLRGIPLEVIVRMLKEIGYKIS